MIEVFMPINGYGNMYLASNLGRVYSKHRSGRFLKPRINRYGYYQVGLTYKGITKTKTIHRLIIESFYGYKELTVNHIDGNKLNNNLSNLEYLTIKDNIRHAHRIGLVTVLKGSEHFNFGKKASDQTKKKMSNSRTGRKFSKEHRKNKALAQLGEKNHRAKLNKSQILEIRKLKKETNKTYEEIAKMFNISKFYVGQIVRKERWKHV